VIIIYLLLGCCVDLFGLSSVSVCIAIMVKSNHTMSHPAVTPSFYVSVTFFFSFFMLLHFFSIFKIFSFSSVFLSSQKAKADPCLPRSSISVSSCFFCSPIQTKISLLNKKNISCIYRRGSSLIVFLKTKIKSSSHFK